MSHSLESSHDFWQLMFLLPVLGKTKDSSGFQAYSSKLNFSEFVREEIFSMISWMSLECFEVNGNIFRYVWRRRMRIRRIGTMTFCFYVRLVYFCKHGFNWTRPIYIYDLYVFSFLLSFEVLSLLFEVVGPSDKLVFIFFTGGDKSTMDFILVFTVDFERNSTFCIVFVSGLCTYCFFCLSWCPSFPSCVSSNYQQRFSWQ